MNLSKEEKKNEFIKLRAKGKSYLEIAKKLNVAKSTLANWNHEFKDDIATLKAMELESLQNQFYLLKEGRISILGNYLLQIKKELDKRKLNTISTDKLFELFLKTFQELKKEYIEVKPLTNQESLFIKGDKNGPKLNELEMISQELMKLLLEFRAGIKNASQVNKEMNILLNIMKAKQFEEIELKLDNIKSILEKRK